LSICSALSRIPSAAVFSSTRDTRLVPGIGTMSSPRASSQARAICADVAPTSPAMDSTSSAMRRLRWKFSPFESRGFHYIGSSFCAGGSGIGTQCWVGGPNDRYEYTFSIASETGWLLAFPDPDTAGK
jgi:hypothetical protein